MHALSDLQSSKFNQIRWISADCCPAGRQYICRNQGKIWRGRVNSVLEIRSILRCFGVGGLSRTVYDEVYSPQRQQTHIRYGTTDRLRLASTWIHSPPRRSAVTLTFDLQNLIRSSVVANEYSLCFIKIAANPREIVATRSVRTNEWTNEARRTDTRKT